MKRATLLLAVLALLLGGVGQAFGAILNNNAGILAPAVTITFEEHVFAGGTQLINQYADLGVTFNNVWYNSQAITSGPVTQPVGENYNGDPTIVNPFSVFFNVNQTSAALALITNDGGVTNISAYLNGVFVEGADFPTSLTPTNGYYGFTGVLFDEIRINVSTDTTNGAGVIDNIQLGTTEVAAVPEPSSLALLGIGIAGMTGYTWRRRKLATV